MSPSRANNQMHTGKKSHSQTVAMLSLSPHTLQAEKKELVHMYIYIYLFYKRERELINRIQISVVIPRGFLAFTVLAHVRFRSGYNLTLARKQITLSHL